MVRWFSSFEIFHCGFKHPDIVIAGYILIQSGADALAVAHLAEVLSASLYFLVNLLAEQSGGSEYQYHYKHSENYRIGEL